MLLGLSLALTQPRYTGAPPALPATLTVPFGVNTPNLYGGYPVCFTAAGTPALTGTAATYFQISTVVDENTISWQMLTPKASRAGLGGTDTTGTLTLGSTVCALTIQNQANAWDVRPNSTANGAETTASQLRTTAQNTAVAFGDTIWLRDGDYNLNALDQRIVRTTAPVGTWTGSNWVRVRGRTAPSAAFFTSYAQYGARVRKMTVSGATVKNQYLSFEDLHGFRPNPGGQVAGTFQLGTTVTVPIAFVQFLNCRFSSDETDATTTAGDTATRHSGIQSIDNNQDITVTNCFFIGLYDGVQLGGSNYSGTEARMTVQGCAFQKIWNDCMKLSCSHPVYILNNLAFDKKYGSDNGVDGPLHGDFCQMYNNNAIAGTYAFGEISGNYLLRATGTPGSSDGQAVFHTCSSAQRGGLGGPSIRYTGAIIRNNLIQNTFIRGISITQCDAPLIERNTILWDTTDISPGSSAQPGIFLRDGGTGGNAATVQRNITSAPNVGNETYNAAGTTTTGIVTTTPATNVFSASGSVVAGYLTGAALSALVSTFPTMTGVQAAYAGTAAALLGDATYAGRFTNTGAENAA